MTFCIWFLKTPNTIRAFKNPNINPTFSNCGLEQILIKNTSHVKVHDCSFPNQDNLTFSN